MPFISTWKTDNTSTGSSSSTQIRIPTISNGTYNCHIDWGDGSSSDITTWDDPSWTHTYSSAGTYTVTITGTFIGLAFQYEKDLLKILNISEWGPFNLGNPAFEWDPSLIGGHFTGCSNLTISATDAPDLSGVLGLFASFGGCSFTHFDGSSWDVSSVLNFSNFFWMCPNLTSVNISNWDVSHATILTAMFGGCTSLTSIDISNWDTSSVTHLDGLFYQCTALTSINISNWNTSNVITLNQLFNQCPSLTSVDLSNWNTSSNTDISYAFYGCSSLVSLNISSWDVSNVEFFGYAFYGCSSLTSLDLSSWDTGACTDARRMFENCSQLTSIGNTNNWNTSLITRTDSMFYNCSSLTSLNTSGWDLNAATTIRGMCYNCSNLTSIDVSNWGISSVTDASIIFRGCTNLTSLDVSSWNTSNVTQTYQTFRDCSSLHSLDVTGWDVTKVTTMFQMFYGTYLDRDSYSNLLISWAGQNVKSSVPFHGGSSKYKASAVSARSTLTTTKSWSITDGGQEAFRSSWKTDNTSTGSSSSTQIKIPVFNGGTYNCHIDWGDGSSSDITTWDDPSWTHTYSSSGTYNIVITGLSFVGFRFAATGDRLKILTVSEWGPFNPGNNGAIFTNAANLKVTATDSPYLDGVTTLQAFFVGCSSLDSINCNRWDVSNVTTFQTVFANCINLSSILIDQWDVSSGVNFSAMFFSVTGVSALTSLNISNWNTPSATNFTNMFSGCSSLASIDLDNWDVSNVTSVEGMFQKCSNLTSVKVNWSSTSKLSTAKDMFLDCTNLTGIDLSNWDTALLTSTYQMFQDSGIQSIDLSEWNTQNLTTINSMFYNCPSLQSVNLNNWDTSNVTSFFAVFGLCPSLSVIDVSGLNTSNSTNFEYLFDGCSDLGNIDVSGFDTSKATSLRSMFRNCSSLSSINVSNWNTSNVTSLQETFRGCSSLTSIDVTDWDVSKVTTMLLMFDGVTLDYTSYSNLLTSWESQSLNSGVTLSGGNSKYSITAATSRQNLISTYNWTITDGGQMPPPNWNITYPKIGSVGGFSSTFIVSTEEDTTAYSVVVLEGSQNPTSLQVKEGKDGDGTAVPVGFNDSSSIPGNIEASLYSINLSQDTVYSAWLVAESSIGGLQTNPVKLDFTTNLAPAYIPGYPKLSYRDSTSARFQAGIDENGVVYFEFLSSQAASPDSTQIKNGLDGDGTAAIYFSDSTVSSSQITTFSVNNITEGSYKGWFICQDSIGNIQAYPRSVSAIFSPNVINFNTPVGTTFTDPDPAPNISENSDSSQIMYLNLTTLPFPIRENQLFKYWVDRSEPLTVTDLNPGSALLQIQLSNDGVNYITVKEIFTPINPKTVGSFTLSEAVNYNHVRINAKMFSPSQIINNSAAYLKAGLSYDFEL